jgi:hypothetical protein
METQCPKETTHVYRPLEKVDGPVTCVPEPIIDGGDAATFGDAIHGSDICSPVADPL